MLDESSVQYLYVCRLIQIILSTPPDTSTVEWVYTYLQVLAAKHRNHLSNENLVTLFLLVSFKLAAKKYT